MWDCDNDLAMPPRRVSLLAQLAVLFGGVLNVVGWLVLFFTMFFVWGFVGNADMTGWYAFDDALSAQGTVVAAESTSAEINEQRVMEYTYTFTDAQGGEQTGVSYSHSEYLQSGEAVPVEYVPGDPSTSRIEGMRRELFGPFVAFVLLFPGVAGVILLFAVRGGLRRVRVLRHGQLAKAVLVEKKATASQVNNQQVYALTFEFEADDGETYRATARTHKTERLTDEATEKLLYDPRDPACAVLWDDLPGSGHVDAMGGLVANGLGGCGVVALPLLNVVVHGGWFLHRYVGAF